MLDALVPKVLQAGPSPGRWRQERLPGHQDRLFLDIVVPITGDNDHWPSLTQALVVAEREAGRIHGLHVIASGADKNNQRNQQIKHEFQRAVRRQTYPVT